MMKTREQVLEAIKAKAIWDRANCGVLDGRDFGRLINFMPVEDWHTLGFKLKDGETHEAKPWTPESLMEQVTRDIQFCHEKATDQRGISSALMHDVVRMWCWVFEHDDLANDTSDYDDYGLAYVEAAAERFGVTV